MILPDILLGNFLFVRYDSIALRVEYFCKLVLLELGLPLAHEAIQLSSLENVPDQKAGDAKSWYVH